MSGIPKIEIIESVEELKSLMKQQKTGLGYAKVKNLYLLKINVVKNVNYLAIIIGRSDVKEKVTKILNSWSRDIIISLAK
jgi:hypothetical protein